MPRQLLAIVFFAWASSSVKADLIAPFTLNLSQLGGSASMSGLTIAGGLNFEDGLATTANGSIVFGQNLATSASGINYGNGQGVTGSVWIQPKMADGTFGVPQK